MSDPFDPFDLLRPRTPATTAPASPRPSIAVPIAQRESSASVAPTVERLFDRRESAVSTSLAPVAAAPVEATAVSALVARVRASVESSFGDQVVRGELANCRPNKSGHFYFTLKDDQAALDCFVPRGFVRSLETPPVDGLQVVARGFLSVYVPGGKLSLQVRQIQPIGAGALALQLEQARRRLAAEGLFSAEHKRPIPRVPRRVGLITSPHGAAIQDFLRVAGLRWAGLPIVVVPTMVQGREAAPTVCEALQRLSAVPDVDVIAVVRGGGSQEDLWAFNEESVVRAIRRCPVPVVTGIGHETDWTLADLAADLRAATPTEAAVRVVTDQQAELAALRQQQSRLSQATLRRIEAGRARVERLQARIPPPQVTIARQREALEQWHRRLDRSIHTQLRVRRSTIEGLDARVQRQHPNTQLQQVRRQLQQHLQRVQQLSMGRLTAGQSQLAALAARLDALSPLRVLGRGYSLVYGPDGRLVRRSNEVTAGDPLRVRLDTGWIDARVERVSDGQTYSQVSTEDQDS